ncbi:MULTISPECIES: AraC-like ligand-binding domain-containing protein [Streptomyces]|uniref:AraC-like ligand-binding domain-containing protein n=1 Tax=Streptomyces TaxID=1883 RepID=UPI00186B14EE|nr:MULTISPECIES: helix-turn-helix domain-containing protein [Streptomyces]
MLRTVFHTDQVATAEERFAAWRECVSRGVVVTTQEPLPTGPERSAFRGVLRAGALGPVRVSAMEYRALVAKRTPRQIRELDPGWYQVGLILHGRQSIALDGPPTRLWPGDMVLYDTTQPFVARVPPALSTGSVVLQLPTGQLPWQRGRLRPLFGRRLPGDDPAVALLRRLLLDLIGPVAGGAGSGWGPSDAGRLGVLVTDLVTAVVERRLDPAEPPSPAGADVLRLRIGAHIERRLADPGLDPTSVAAAHHISVRYLHRIFQPSGGVATAIRALRLERCRRDLLDPALADTPVSSIGARWGFTRPSDFGRAFRAAYGLPPGAYRREALAARPVPVGAPGA